MKNLFQKRLFSSINKIPPSYNNKGARNPIYTPPEHLKTPEERDIYMRNLKKEMLVELRMDNHPQLKHYQIANRVLETVNPGEFRRIEKRDDRRRKDRAIIRDFCKKVLYIHEKYIP